MTSPTLGNLLLSFCISIYIRLLRLRGLLCLFALALRGYSVASLPLALQFGLRARILNHFAPSGFVLCVYILSCFTPSGFTLTSCSLRSSVFLAFLSQIFGKKRVSHSTLNALKRIDMQKKTFYPYDPLCASLVAQSPSSEAQPYLPRSVHTKFHANWTKTVGARGIQTNRQTNRPVLIIWITRPTAFISRS